MELSERKQKILKAIVDLYIRSAEPVGSKTIAALPDMNFSSATIRNEMAELTTLGFLEQPHTSAGRIPSPAGYRFYIDRLMQDYRLSVDETQSINQAMESRMQELDKAMSQVGKLVSKLTNLPAYTMTAPAGEVTVRHFEIILADAGSFILVVMTSDENVKNRLIKLPLHVTEQDLKLLSAVLNASLTGLPASGFTPEVMNRVTRSAGAAASLVPVIVDFTTHVLEEAHRSEIYLTGQNRLLGQPEYQDLTKAQEVLGALDEDTLSNLPARLDPDSPVQILVGPENVAQELKDTSVVVTRFDIGDGMQGMIGVVGPQRMDYAQITARLSYFAEGLGRMFGKPELPAAPKPEVHEAKKHEEPEKNEKEPAAPEAAKQAEAPKQPEGSKQKAESKQPDALEQAKAAQAQEHDQFLRLAAEYDNFRKRTQREKDGIYQDAVADTVKKFLPVYDNLERALHHETADEAYKKGVEMTLTELVKILDALGIKPFGEAGETFDPQRHNAVMHIEDESLGENVIAEVFQTGFAHGDKVIRFAMVKVAN